MMDRRACLHRAPPKGVPLVACVKPKAASPPQPRPASPPAASPATFPAKVKMSHSIVDAIHRIVWCCMSLERASACHIHPSTLFIQCRCLVICLLRLNVQVRSVAVNHATRSLPPRTDSSVFYFALHTLQRKRALPNSNSLLLKHVQICLGWTSRACITPPTCAARQCMLHNTPPTG